MLLNVFFICLKLYSSKSKIVKMIFFTFKSKINKIFFKLIYKLIFIIYLRQYNFHFQLKLYFT